MWTVRSRNFSLSLHLWAWPYEAPNLYLADGVDLKIVGPTKNVTTIPIAESRSVAVDGVGNAFISGANGFITRVSKEGAVSLFASGLNSPYGMAFRPKRYSDTEAGVGDLFIAETDGGVVSEYAMDGKRTVFASGGNPKFLAFELILPGKLLNISTRLDDQTGDDVLIGGSSCVAKMATPAVAMVEVYDLDKDADSELANISTRGFVQTGDDCMIGGFIIDQSETARVLVRAIGKSLAERYGRGAQRAPESVSRSVRHGW